MLTLRPYQQEALDAIYDHLRRRDDNPCCVLPTGAGKTPLLARICQDTAEKWHGRILVLSHVKELLEQAASHLASFLPINMVGLHSAGLGRRDTEHPVIVAGIQTVANKAGELGRFDMIVVDECFPAGTMIHTPRGELPIERVRIGQPIYHALGLGEIEAISIRKETDLLEMELDDGTEITCTRNHPFFTPAGWCEAWRLEAGSTLFCQKDLRMLRERVYAVDQIQSRRNDSKLYEREPLDPSTVLYDILLQEAQQPNERQKNAGSDAVDLAPNQASTDQERWQWSASDHSSTGITSCPGPRMGSRACCDDRDPSGERNSETLQNRHCASREDDRRGAGWSIAPDRVNSSGGYAEGSFFGSKRVVRVTPVKSSCPSPVYNLHVSGHPSYYAGGVLVHNCHLIPETGEGRYLTFLREARYDNPNVRVVGLTATPFRLGSGLLCKPGNMLNHVCYEANVKELIVAGWLCPLRTKRGLECANLDGVRINSTGDFASDEMQAAFESIIKPACTELAALCADRHSVLIFAAGLEHAAMVAEILGGEVITGKTPKEERAAIIARFRAGEIRYLVNVNVLTTGFDAPNVDAVVLLRATMSAGLYCQMVGRGLRKHPSKQDCLILDYGDNAVRHGPIDQIEVQERGKGDKAADAPGKECPNCHEVIGVQFRICPECDYEFPVSFTSRHNREAGDAPILSDEAKVSEVDIESVVYEQNTKHKENGVSVTFRVKYIINSFTGKMVNQFLCFDHPKGNYGRKVAEEWWRERSNAPVPDTVMDALAMAKVGALCEPVKLTLVQNAGKKYPEIVGMELPEKPEWQEIAVDEDFFADSPSCEVMDVNDLPF